VGCYRVTVENGGADGSDVLEHAQTGAPAALDRLVQRFSPRLLALIRLRLGPSLRARLESRDILQETWLKALSRLDGFRGDSTGSFTAWLARIAANEIRDQVDYNGRQRRDGGREERLSAEELDGLAARVRSETSRLALDEWRMRLEHALESLPRDQREVIVLRKLEEQSFQEVAEHMGRSPDACRMLLARAMAALSALMAKPA
jgi:RNA polymerase sigma-70 factor, ECF subfamily